MSHRRSGFLVIAALLAAVPAWAVLTPQGYVNTITQSGGAATLIAQCRAVGCKDINRVLNGGNTSTLTLTTPPAGAMRDGEELYVQVIDDGSHAPSSIAWTAGTGVTPKSLQTADTSATWGAAFCGTPTAAGTEWYSFAWNATQGTLTLGGCGSDPPAGAIPVAQGGTGLTTLTAHATQVGEGTAAPAQVAPGSVVGYAYQSNGSSADPSFVARPAAPGFWFPGTVANSAFQCYTCASNVQLQFPASLQSNTWPDGNSAVSCGVNPSGSASDYTITVNGTQKGDVSLSTSCAPTWTAGTFFQCTSGQRLCVNAPSLTHGEANVSITLAGHSPP